jgi:hypothetical protein
LAGDPIDTAATRKILYRELAFPRRAEERMIAILNHLYNVSASSPELK